MPDDPDLPTLLAHVLVALTVEFDDEFEVAMKHRTTRRHGSDGRSSGPWLTSRVMGANGTLHLGNDESVTVAELERRARTTRTSLAGLRRWGYVRIGGDPPGRRPPGGRQGTTPDAEVSLTGWGRRANAVWSRLPDRLEARWRERFGADAVDELVRALDAVLGGIQLPLPRSVPVVAPAAGGRLEPPPHRAAPTDQGPDLLARLSRVFHALALEVEAAIPVGVAVAATTLRALSSGSVPVRDLPARSGLAREASTMHVGLLVRRGWAAEEPDPSGRGKRIRLTARGAALGRDHGRAVATTVEAWRERWGAPVVADLHRALGAIDTGADGSGLLAGLVHPPDTWRAAVRQPVRLPDAPVVLHRGGFPDGS